MTIVQNTPNLLIGGFEREVQRQVGWTGDEPELEAALERSLRLAILFSAERALIPAAGYFETSTGHRLIDRYKLSQELDRLAITGTGAGPNDFICFKVDHWRTSPRDLQLYEESGPRRAAQLDGSAWRTKRAPTDPLLFANWARELQTGTHPLLETFGAHLSPVRAQRAVAAIPARLEGTVMLADNIAGHLPAKVALTLSQRHRLWLHLAQGFFASYQNDSGALALVDSGIHMPIAIFPDVANAVSDLALRRLLRALGLERVLLEEGSSDLLGEVAASEAWRGLGAQLIERAGGGPSRPFSRRERKALERCAERERSPPRAETGAVEAAIDRRHEALERVSRRGSGWGLQLSWMGEGAAEALAAQRTFGEARWLGLPDGMGREIGPARLEGQLLEIFRSSDTAELGRRIAALDKVVGQQEIASPEAIAELIEERAKLKAGVRGLRPRSQQAIFSIATGAGGSVVARGLELAIRALGG